MILVRLAPKINPCYNEAMPDKRSHRGPGPKDAELFAKTHVIRLTEAVVDLNWLLSRGYAETSGLKLVGDRYRLTERQRTAVMRCACSEDQRQRRRESELRLEDVCGKPAVLDGYNVLITVEAALSGAVLLRGSDGCIRDVAGIHGTYRNVEETQPAIRYITDALGRLETGDVLWLLDRPVSNSGRLRQRLLNWSDEKNLNWQVELVPDPDFLLIRSDRVILTSDSAVLDRCRCWFNFIPQVLRAMTFTPNGPWLIDLAG